MRCTSFLAALCLVTALSAPGLYADGCFVWNKGADIAEPSQKAIILYRDGREDLILQVKYTGPVDEFGWIVPVPGKPAVEKASMKCFYELSEFVQREGRSGRGKGLGDQGPGVEVIELKTVGDYDVAVLAATDAKALAGWLARHRFKWPAGRRDVLDHYVKKKWYFVAAKVHLARAKTDTALAKRLRSGELHPLKMTFDTAECVYPLKISSVNKGPSEVHLYVFGPRPLVTDRMDFFSETHWSGPVDVKKLQACVKDLPRLARGKWFLVKHRRVFYPKAMADLTLRPCEGEDWGRARNRFLARYFTKCREQFFEDLREYERLLGHSQLNNISYGYRGRLHNELGYVDALGKAAPDVAADLALDLIKNDDVWLLRRLFQHTIDADLDAVSTRLGRKVLELRDPKARRYRLRRAYVDLLLRLGAKAGAGVALLLEAFPKPGDGRRLNDFPVPPEQMGILVRNCPGRKGVDRLVGHLKHPHTAKYVVPAFWYVRSEKAVEPLIALLAPRDLDRYYARNIIRALGHSGDGRAVGPLVQKLDQDPQAALPALGGVDPDRAYRTASGWLGEVALANRKAAWRYVGYADLSDERRAAVRKAVFDQVEGEKAPELLYPMARALIHQTRPGDAAVSKAAKALEHIRGRLSRAGRHNLDIEIRAWKKRLGRPADAKPGT